MIEGPTILVAKHPVDAALDHALLIMGMYFYWLLAIGVVLWVAGRPGVRFLEAVASVVLARPLRDPLLEFTQFMAETALAAMMWVWACVDYIWYTNLGLAEGPEAWTLLAPLPVAVVHYAVFVHRTRLASLLDGCGEEPSSS